MDPIGAIIIIWSIIGMAIFIIFNDYWPKKLTLRIVLYGPLMWYAYALVTLRKRADQAKKEH